MGKSLTVAIIVTLSLINTGAPKVWATGELIGQNGSLTRGFSGGSLTVSPLGPWDLAFGDIFSSSSKLKRFLIEIGKPPRGSFPALQSSELQTISKAFADTLSAAGVLPEQFPHRDRKQIAKDIERGHVNQAQAIKALEGESSPVVIGRALQDMEPSITISEKYFPSDELKHLQAADLLARHRLWKMVYDQLPAQIKRTSQALGQSHEDLAQIPGAALPALPQGSSGKTDTRGALQLRAPSTCIPSMAVATRAGSSRQVAMSAKPGPIALRRETYGHALIARARNALSRVSASVLDRPVAKLDMHLALARNIVDKALASRDGWYRYVSHAVKYLGEVNDQDSTNRLLRLLNKHTPADSRAVDASHRWKLITPEGSSFQLTEPLNYSYFSYDKYGSFNYVEESRELQGQIIRALTKILSPENARLLVLELLKSPAESLSERGAEALMGYAVESQASDLASLLLARAKVVKDIFEPNMFCRSRSFMMLYMYETLAYGAYRVAEKNSPEHREALQMLIDEFNHPKAQGAWVSRDRPHCVVDRLLFQIVVHHLADDWAERAWVMDQLEPRHFHQFDLANEFGIQNILRTRFVDPWDPWDDPLDL